MNTKPDAAPTLQQLVWQVTETNWAANDLRRARNFWRGLAFVLAVVLTGALTLLSR